jgi:transposase
MRQDVRMPQRKRRNFSAEQKANAVRLVHEVGNLEKVGRDLDINRHVLYRWVHRAAIDSGKGPEGALTSEERAELTRLRRENRTLQMERDFLKKAAAFFAKDQDRPAS